MKTLRMCGASAWFAILCLSACSGGSPDYPKEYVGFEKISDNYSFDKKSTEQEITIKIIAAEKEETDREVTLSGKKKPGRPAVFKLLDQKVIIPAKKKSVLARIRIYPQKIESYEEIRIICSPKNKEVKETQLTLKLATK